MSKNKNILVLTYWGFNSPILNAYAAPYLRIIKKNIGGGKIFLFTLTPENNKNNQEYKIIEEAFEKEGIILINFNYRPFGFLMALKFVYIFYFLFTLILKQRIGYIHAWCTPGGAIGYILSLFTRKTLILDSFEPHAESMVETGTWRKNSFAYKILFKLEKLQLKRARYVICAADGMINYSQKVYGIKKNEYFVKPACVDLNLFSEKKKNFSLAPGIDKDSIVCVYIGKFGDIYLKQEVFDFFKVASDVWKERFKVLLLTNHSDEEITEFCKNSHLNPDIIIKRFVHHSKVPEYMALGSFGICPVQPVPTKEFCTPIKNGEYWAMGLPIVITKNISTDSDLIKHNGIGYVLESLTTEEYAKAVETINRLIKEPGLSIKIRNLAEKHRNYSIAEKIYKTIYSE